MREIKLSKEFMQFLNNNDCSLTLEPYEEGLQFSIIGNGQVGIAWGIEWEELDKLPSSYIETTVRTAVQLDRHKWKKGGRYAA